MLEHPHKWSDLTVQGSSLWIGSNTQGIHKVPVRTSGFFQMLFFHVCYCLFTGQRSTSNNKTAHIWSHSVSAVSSDQHAADTVIPWSHVEAMGLNIKRKGFLFIPTQSVQYIRTKCVCHDCLFNGRQSQLKHGCSQIISSGPMQLW